MCKHMAVSNSVSRSLRILRTEMDSLLNCSMPFCFRDKLLRQGERVKLMSSN